MVMKKLSNTKPSIDKWLSEAKAEPVASKIGMFLIHNGVVRQTPKAKVRQGLDNGSVVKGMEFSFDAEKVEEIITDTYKLNGVFYVKVWLNEGQLKVGDDIMYALIGGDIRPNVVAALQFLVEKIKTECVTEIELRA
ncbi:MAG: molybdenum cofactor biosynthesis protein MoaE [Bacillota bacterium]|nr:molybdenum cofactor biosynthesis protein MoaE [Bacillota bacterium]